MEIPILLKYGQATPKYKEENMKQYLPLIHKLTHKFHNRTGIEYEDLFSEACLIYAKAINHYDPDKAKEITFIWNCINNGLIDYCLRDKHENEVELDENTIFDHKNNPEKELINKEFKSLFLSKLSEEAKEVCQIIFESPGEFLEVMSPKARRGLLIKKLRKMEWTWKSIWDSIKEIKTILNESK